MPGRLRSWWREKLKLGKLKVEMGSHFVAFRVRAGSAPAATDDVGACAGGITRWRALGSTCRIVGWLDGEIRLPSRRIEANAHAVRASRTSQNQKSGGGLLPTRIACMS